jgi:hypothetical protein
MSPLNASLPPLRAPLILYTPPTSVQRNPGPAHLAYTAGTGCMGWLLTRITVRVTAGCRLSISRSLSIGPRSRSKYSVNQLVVRFPSHFLQHCFVPSRSVPRLRVATDFGLFSDLGREGGRETDMLQTGIYPCQK